MDEQPVTRLGPDSGGRAPGEAGSPLAITLRSALGSSVGCSSWSRLAGTMRALSLIHI